MTIEDLIIKYADEVKAHQYFGSIRWADGEINCPYCDNKKVYVYKNGILYKCQACRKQFRVTTGTPMQNSKIQLLATEKGKCIELPG